MAPPAHQRKFKLLALALKAPSYLLLQSCPNYWTWQTLLVFGSLTCHLVHVIIIAHPGGSDLSLLWISTALSIPPTRHLSLHCFSCVPLLSYYIKSPRLLTHTPQNTFILSTVQCRRHSKIFAKWNTLIRFTIWKILIINYFIIQTTSSLNLVFSFSAMHNLIHIYLQYVLCK